MAKIYLIGSLRNPVIPYLAKEIREKTGHEVFDDWHYAGPETDDWWMKDEKIRGRTFKQALEGAHAEDVFNFDKRNLDTSNACVLVCPAGKSSHIELGYMIGKGKPSFILLDKEPERFDLMVKFTTEIFYTKEALIDCLKKLSTQGTTHHTRQG